MRWMSQHQSTLFLRRCMRQCCLPGARICRRHPSQLRWSLQKHQSPPIWKRSLQSPHLHRLSIGVVPWKDQILGISLHFARRHRKQKTKSPQRTSQPPLRMSQRLPQVRLLWVIAANSHTSRHLVQPLRRRATTELSMMRQRSFQKSPPMLRLRAEATLRGRKKLLRCPRQWTSRMCSGSRLWLRQLRMVPSPKMISPAMWMPLPTMSLRMLQQKSCHHLRTRQLLLLLQRYNPSVGATLQDSSNSSSLHLLSHSSSHHWKLQVQPCSRRTFD
mmetsp:Transcript_25351/g.58944  ORF Transcript_25351/g.58944 Transcript_25351/m.58944 type:complete len:273 (+) Transcript_25351:739-1557(+)